MILLLFLMNSMTNHMIILTFIMLMNMTIIMGTRMEASQIQTNHWLSHSQLSHFHQDLLPVQTLDSSFVKAKGFSFPGMDSAISADNPGQHQFLKPDSSVFYSSESYKIIKNNELSDFTKAGAINLNDEKYMKGMEVIYNFPGEFMGKTITFTGFAYKGEQVDGEHYFIFRFGFIHCAADSGVFGMLVDLPERANLEG